MHIHEAIEFNERGVLHIEGFNMEKKNMSVYAKLDLRKPTFFDKVRAYLALAVPAAMLARVIRSTRGRKGTTLENACMKYYYDKTVEILKV